MSTFDGTGWDDHSKTDKEKELNNWISITNKNNKHPIKKEINQVNHSVSSILQRREYTVNVTDKQYKKHWTPTQIKNDSVHR